MIACTSNNANYNVTGNNATQNGVAVYLFDPISQTRIDSTVIDNGTFKLKGKAEKNAYLMVNIEGNQWWFPFFNDGEPVQNVPRSLKEEGHKVLELSENGDGTYTLFVEKGALAQ